MRGGLCLIILGVSVKGWCEDGSGLSDCIISSGDEYTSVE